MPCYRDRDRGQIYGPEEQLEQEKKAHEETKTLLETADRKASDLNIEVLRLKDQLAQKASNENEERFVKLEMELKNHKEETAKQLKEFKEQTEKEHQERDLLVNLKLENEELTAKYWKLFHENQAVQVRNDIGIQQLQGKLKDSERKEQMKDREIKNLQKSHDKEIQKLQKRLDDEKLKLELLKDTEDRKIEELQVEIAQSEAYSQILKAELETTSQNLQELDEEQKRKDQEIQLLEKKVKDDRTTIEIDKQNIRYLLKTIEKSSQENISKDFVIQQLQKKLDENMKRFSDLEMELEEQKEKKANLKDQKIDALKKSHDEEVEQFQKNFAYEKSKIGKISQAKDQNGEELFKEIIDLRLQNILLEDINPRQ